MGVRIGTIGEGDCEGGWDGVGMVPVLLATLRRGIDGRMAGRMWIGVRIAAHDITFRNVAHGRIGRDVGKIVAASAWRGNVAKRCGKDGFIGRIALLGRCTLVGKAGGTRW